MATFDERAKEWDTPDRIERAAEVAAVIGEAVPLTGSERAIEVGAGTGLLGLRFAGRLQELVLTDPTVRSAESRPASSARRQHARAGTMRASSPFTSLATSMAGLRTPRIYSRRRSSPHGVVSSGSRSARPSAPGSTESPPTARWMRCAPAVVATTRG